MSKFKGKTVTAKRWYMPRRVWGKVVSYAGNNSYAIEGLFGLETFHKSNIRFVNRSHA